MYYALTSTSSEWPRFASCVRALKVREEAEKTQIMIMECHGNVLGQYLLFRVISISLQASLGYLNKESTTSFLFLLNIDSHILLWSKALDYSSKDIGSTSFSNNIIPQNIILVMKLSILWHHFEPELVEGKSLSGSMAFS